ncbi:hypothetical protein CDIK_0155 [Cucumispora dikerogammari]|nr:hypothetical protein CDIK_0155 [Cucumispora dikerogammari]
MLVQFLQAVYSEKIFNAATKTYLGDHLSTITPTTFESSAESIGVIEMDPSEGDHLIRLKDAKAFTSKYWYRTPDGLIKSGEASVAGDIPSRFSVIMDKLSGSFKLTDPAKENCVTVVPSGDFDKSYALKLLKCTNFGDDHSLQLFEKSTNGVFGVGGGSYYSSRYSTKPSMSYSYSSTPSYLSRSYTTSTSAPVSSSYSSKSYSSSSYS